ncbi:phosphatidic acid phosphatase [Brachybacterium vulturis]|uniref:Phosphatidic acid phosphatase n=1 Tax=Brachybacterium vulturis TaxID=2017484 RepID=A0A291GLH6_9MICO|nr:phosphatase PAP2 family protein [Brachybacterium vulturis]ATG51065.1 phosphatidic acid phosphatase [Brachybacterium vulturis]
MNAAPTTRSGGFGRPLLSLLAAAVSVLAVVALARTAVGTASGQRLDQLVSSGAKGHDGRLSHYAEIAVGTVSLPVIGALLVLAVLLVLLRRRPGLLLPIGTLVLGANLTTQLIKRVLLTREVLGPGIEVTPNSFPSGHTTLAATAMIALVLAGGRARVVLAPLGVVWTTAAGIGTLVVGWHRPSDVIGAITVVAAWTFLTLALDGLDTRRRRVRAAAHPGRGRRRRGARTPDPLSPPRSHPVERVVATLLGLVGVAGLAWGGFGLLTLPRPLDLHDPAQQLPAFLVTAALIGGGTASWLALTLLLRVPTSHRTRSADRVP